jgi:hypothetical protein
MILKIKTNNNNKREKLKLLILWHLLSLLCRIVIIRELQNRSSIVRSIATIFVVVVVNIRIKISIYRNYYLVMNQPLSTVYACILYI